MASRQGGMEISYIDAESKVAVSRSVGGSLIDQHSLSQRSNFFQKETRALTRGFNNPTVPLLIFASCFSMSSLILEN